MKIGVSGVHGTGKSSFALDLAYKNKMNNPDKTVYLIQETVADCPYPINEECSYESQMWLLSAQIQRELDAETKYDIIICDRTVIDPLAYAMALGIDEFKASAQDIIKNYLQTYDRIVFLDDSRDFSVDDGIRSMNTEFRNNVAGVFKRVFEHYNIHRNMLWLHDTAQSFG